MGGCMSGIKNQAAHLCQAHTKSRRFFQLVFAFSIALFIQLQSLPSNALTRQPTGSPLESLEDSRALVDRLSAQYDGLVAGAIDLLSALGTQVNDSPGGFEPYNRRHHFGGWVNEDSDKNCLDTRAEVMVRDAADPSSVQFRPDGCVVIKGLWHDPYTGTDFKTANAIQIDHVVPLKNAYESGAHDWEPPRRCHYANFLHNRFHLLAVNAHENMSKGDKSPERYMPPDTKFQCEYLHDWMMIKTIWQLSVTRAELSAVVQYLNQNRCPAETAEIAETALRAEREASLKPIDKCAGFGQN
jgi:hypothetical protein